VRFLLENLNLCFGFGIGFGGFGEYENGEILKFVEEAGCENLAVFFWG
jgi:hypothetical protein